MVGARSHLQIRAAANDAPRGHARLRGSLVQEHLHHIGEPVGVRVARNQQAPGLHLEHIPRALVTELRRDVDGGVELRRQIQDGDLPRVEVRRVQARAIQRQIQATRIGGHGQLFQQRP